MCIYMLLSSVTSEEVSYVRFWVLIGSVLTMDLTLPNSLDAEQRLMGIQTTQKQ